MRYDALVIAAHPDDAEADGRDAGPAGRPGPADPAALELLAGASLFLLLMFFGPTKLLPIAADVVVLGAALTNWSPVAAQ